MRSSRRFGSSRGCGTITESAATIRCSWLRTGAATAEIPLS
jgi:hypothetical protein